MTFLHTYKWVKSDLIGHIILGLIRIKYFTHKEEPFRSDLALHSAPECNAHAEHPRLNFNRCFCFGDIQFSKNILHSRIDQIKGFSSHIIPIFHLLIWKILDGRIQSTAFCQQSRYFMLHSTFVSYGAVGWHTLQVFCLSMTSLKHLFEDHSLNETRCFESLLCFVSPTEVSHQGHQADAHACSIVWCPLLVEKIKDTTCNKETLETSLIFL